MQAVVLHFAKPAMEYCKGNNIALKTDNDNTNRKAGVWGEAPMRVVSRWCRCVVQRLCATDCKRPCLVRAAAPQLAPARMPGVYAQRLCTMQSQQSIQSPSPWGRGLGLGIINLHYLKNTIILL